MRASFLLPLCFLVKQHACTYVCRCSRLQCFWQLQCRPGSSAGKLTKQGVSTTSSVASKAFSQTTFQQAVQLLFPLSVEGSLLANLHVLRCIDLQTSEHVDWPAGCPLEAGESIPNWTRCSSTYVSMLFQLALAVRHTSSTRHLLQDWHSLTIPCTVRACQQINRD